MNVTFPCPQCERVAALDLPAEPWQCAVCGHRLEPQVPDATLTTCVLCGNTEIYKKKNFPHWLGLTILTVACLGFLIGHALLEPWWAWSILLVSAAVDGLLYLYVGDALVCYRCNAHYRGVPAAADHKPFELVVSERYRQEQLRREELKVRSQK